MNQPSHPGSTDVTASMPRLPLSVVVPLFNERDNIELLVNAIRAALPEDGGWEIILVDDGSTDGTTGEIRRMAEHDSRVRLIRLARNYGQTTALQAGFDQSSGRVVVSMDGDLQNDPADIPLLVRTLEEGDYDLVAGYRMERRDSARRRFPSAVGNILARAVTGVNIRDTGCTLRAYRRELLQGFVIYSDLHRFIPAVAVSLRGARITEIPVRHQPRMHGRSKYGISRAPRVLSDLLVLLLIRSFRERPLYMFARGTGLCLLAALLSTIPSLLETFEPGGRRSLILPALPLIWLELACFLILMGLVAEVVLRRHRTDRRGATVLVRGIS
jgi:glycosyltransferase involved in cell wall biosynthesis